MLRITSSDSLIVNYIKDNTPDKAVVFITGIGKCYPIIRSHTILNNLHQVIDKSYDVCFPEFQMHLSFVQFSYVHQLIDQT